MGARNQGASLRSEVDSFFGVSEQRARRCPIRAQSTTITRAMASICNNERVACRVMSGHDRETLSLSGQVWRCPFGARAGQCRLDDGAFLGEYLRVGMH